MCKTVHFLFHFQPFFFLFVFKHAKNSQWKFYLFLLKTLIPTKSERTRTHTPIKFDSVERRKKRKFHSFMIYANEASLFSSFFLIHDSKRYSFSWKTKRGTLKEKSVLWIELWDYLFFERPHALKYKMRFGIEMMKRKWMKMKKKKVFIMIK